MKKALACALVLFPAATFAQTSLESAQVLLVRPRAAAAKAEAMSPVENAQLVAQFAAAMKQAKPGPGGFSAERWLELRGISPDGGRCGVEIVERVPEKLALESAFPKGSTVISVTVFPTNTNGRDGLGEQFDPGPLMLDGKPLVRDWLTMTFDSIAISKDQVTQKKASTLGERTTEVDFDGKGGIASVSIAFVERRVDGSIFDQKKLSCRRLNP